MPMEKKIVSRHHAYLLKLSQTMDMSKDWSAKNEKIDLPLIIACKGSHKIPQTREFAGLADIVDYR